jgi:propanol-preferring alcohol dehydrogenase
MRAVELPAVGAPLRLVDRPVPEPGPGEVRVRVEACGVCGSDLFLQAGGFGVPLPIVPGHEAAGVVDALGAGVEGLPVGQQVALYYIDSPPESPWVARGRPNVGPDVQRMGVDVDGAFADYVVRPARTLVPSPARVDAPTLAVLTDAVGTPYHALRLARLEAGETLVVLGVGGIGSNAVQLGKHLGARVVAVSRSDEKLGLARALGADEVVQAAGDETVARVSELCGDEADVVVQCVGSAAVDEQAIAIAGFAGRVVLVGAALEPFRARAVDLIWRELTVLGSRGFTPDDIRAVIDLYLGGDIRVDHLTSRIRPLEEANAALEDLREGRVLRTVLATET